MKIIHMIIGIAMVLMLCISPVGGFTGEDFRIIIEDSDKLNIHTYTYQNWAYVNEKYFKIYTGGTRWLCSCVTLKPANISDAPVMVVDTGNTDKLVTIYLPHSVDEWEIKYYSNSDPFDKPDDKYLKNAGTVNLNKFFKNQIKNGEGLYLELSWNQHIHSVKSFDPCYYIPKVK